MKTKLTDKISAVIPTKLLPGETQVMVWFTDPEPGTPVEALLAPGYWSHVAKHLRPGHRIEALTQDGAWWAMLIVRAVGRAEARVQILQHEMLGEPEELSAPDDPEFEAKWRGPARKWSVVRKSDGEVIKENLPEKGDAVRWISNNVRRQAA